MKIVQLIQTLKDVNKNRNFQNGNLIDVRSCFKKWKQPKESERKELWIYLCDATYSIASTVKIICDNRYKYLLYLSQAQCRETSVLIYTSSVYRPDFCERLSGLVWGLKHWKEIQQRHLLNRSTPSDNCCVTHTRIRGSSVFDWLINITIEHNYICVILCCYHWATCFGPKGHSPGFI